MSAAPVARALVTGVVVLAACHRGDPRCAPAAPATLELRDGAGALLLADKGGALCDAQHRAVGAIEVTPDAVTLKDAGGSPRLILKATMPENTAAGTDAAGTVRVRLYRDAVQARVLRPDGVPLGSMVRNGDGARIYDPGSSPIMTAEPRDRDLVLRDSEGVVRHFVVPGRDARAAGVFSMNSLDRSEQLAIYLFWSR
jgi:hypothetical protein